MTGRVNSSHGRVDKGLHYGVSSQLKLIEHDIMSTDYYQVALCSPPDGRDVDLLMGGCHKCIINKPTDFDRPGPEGVSRLSLGQV